MGAQIIEFRPEGEHEWSQWAECAKYGAPGMFPHDTDTQGIAWAKSTCLSCPVRSECLTEAFQRNERWGVWGGLTTEERDTFRRGNTRRVRDHGDVPMTAEEMADAAALDDAAEALADAS